MDNTEEKYQKLLSLVKCINSKNNCDFKNAEIVTAYSIKNEEKSIFIVVEDVFFKNRYKLLSDAEQRVYLSLTARKETEIVDTLVKELCFVHENQKIDGNATRVLNFLKRELHG